MSRLCSKLKTAINTCMSIFLWVFMFFSNGEKYWPRQTLNLQTDVKPKIEFTKGREEKTVPFWKAVDITFLLQLSPLP